MAIKTLQVPESVHTQMVEDARANGGLKLFAMVGVYQRNWHNSNADQHLAALRGQGANPGILPTERSASLGKLCNLIQRGAIEIDALVDEVTEDGVVDPDERAKVRQALKHLFDRICEAAAHVAEPSAVPA